MNIQARIEHLSGKKLVGLKLTMSLNENKTFQLWRSFMPRRKEIINNLNTDLLSMQVYNNPMALGDLNQSFDKWSVVEVSDFENVPAGMETFILSGGLYAVFDYVGLSSDRTIFRYIFGDWLPNSNYQLDNRPHFEILSKKYKNEDPNSEEEIWIPIREII